MAEFGGFAAPAQSPSAAASAKGPIVAITSVDLNRDGLDEVVIARESGLVQVGDGRLEFFPSFFFLKKLLVKGVTWHSAFPAATPMLPNTGREVLPPRPGPPATAQVFTKDEQYRLVEQPISSMHLEESVSSLQKGLITQPSAEECVVQTFSGKVRVPRGGGLLLLFCPSSSSSCRSFCCCCYRRLKRRRARGAAAFLLTCHRAAGRALLTCAGADTGQ